MTEPLVKFLQACETGNLQQVKLSLTSDVDIHLKMNKL